MFITTYLNLERCQVPDSREYRFLLEGSPVAIPHNLVKIVVSFPNAHLLEWSISLFGNIATGETSPAITPYHYFGNFNFLNLHH